MSFFFKFFKQLKSYSLFLSLIFISDVIVTIFGLFVPLLSRVLFDYAYPLKDFFLIHLVAIITMGIFFIEFILNMFSDYLETYTEQSFTFDLTTKLFSRCQHLPLNFHQRKGIGDLIQRFTKDIDVITAAIIQTMPQVIIQLFMLISILMLAFSMNYKITFLILVSVPLYIIETRYFSKKEEKLEEEEIQLTGEFYDTLQERFKNIMTIKAFGQEDHETQRVGRKRREMNIIAIKQGLVTVISTFANSIIVRLWLIFVSWYMGYLVIQNQLTIGEIVVLITYSGMIQSPIRELAQIYRATRIGTVSFRRVNEILSHPIEDEGQNLNKDFVIKQGCIRFERVDFSYNPNDRKIFDQLSLSLKPRTAIAIVGESGSGKSTLISLILRFFNIRSGVIYIDNQNITEVKVRILRNQIGLIEQDFTLFQGSIRENIIYGSSGKTEEDLIKVSRQAQIYDYIRSLPYGFDTQIGYRGVEMSRGQKQRLAIARVLLKDPPIIIFDEATSALDPESEFKITEVINDLIGRKTLIIIAHRLSTIKNADRVLMLEEGRIVEEGTFANLLNKKGAFFKFYNHQFGGIEEFKKILEIEYERLNRYGSIFNLGILKAGSFNNIVSKQGMHVAKQLMREVELVVKKNLRKIDSATYFCDDYILVLLPEINEDQITAFYQRLDNLLLKTEIVLENGMYFSNTFRYCFLRVKSSEFRLVEDLIKLGIDKLENSQLIHEHCQIYTIEKGKKLNG